MDVLRIVSPIYGENCYVVITADKSALVIDPGAKTVTRITEVLSQLNAELAAILLTHGHADHLWNTAQVSACNPQAPVYLAKPDHFWMDDPGPGVQLGVDDYFVEMDGEWKPVAVQTPPDELFTEGGAQIIPGLTLRALPAPGHSPGCTMFFGADKGEDHGQGLGFDGRENQAFCFSGDVVFKGSVGRTDLPHSDPEVMTETLRTLKISINPDTLLLPGHGETTTWAAELTSNPFLR